MLNTINRKKYPSNVNDEEWEIINEFMPPKYNDGVERKYEYREIII
jgi:hypothetical protein